jgi:holin-like protein
MDLLGGIALLLGAQLLGELAARALELPVPGPVIGMALLATGLALRGHVPPGLARAADGLLRFLPLFFVPAGAGVAALSDTFSEAWLPLVAAIVVSTAVALAVTALAVRLVLALGRRR